MLAGFLYILYILYSNCFAQSAGPVKEHGKGVAHPSFCVCFLFCAPPLGHRFSSFFGPRGSFWDPFGDLLDHFWGVFCALFARGGSKRPPEGQMSGLGPRPGVPFSAKITQTRVSERFFTGFCVVCLRVCFRTRFWVERVPDQRGKT